MKRLTTLLLVAGAGLLTACTTDPATAVARDKQATVTETVTEPESAPPTAEEQPAADGNPPVCDAAQVEVGFEAGEPKQDYWNTEIVLTNGGPYACRLDGAGQLEFFTGGDGRPLGIQQVVGEGGEGELTILNAGDQAAMGLGWPTAAPGSRTDCMEGGAFAQIALDGDDGDVVEAQAADPQVGLPPVCGEVTVTAWLFRPPV